MTYAYILLDVAVLGLLVLFGLWGAKRGFVLSLCGLFAVVVAIFGASLLSHYITPIISNFLAPHLTPIFEGWLVQEGVPQQSGFLWRMMEQALLHSLPETVAGALPQVTTAAALAITVAGWIANATSFLLTFMVILLLWTLLSHALNLVSKLPGLNMLNKTAGLMVGLIKGAVVLFVGAWVLRHLDGFVPPELTAQTTLFRFFMTMNPMTLITM
ncbi:MAG: CvpA family protein, partial [Oscillospiraceae bacterium]